MGFEEDEKLVESRKIQEKWSKEIKKEIEEQCISGPIVTLITYELVNMVGRLQFYLQSGRSCSQSQFLRALEVVLRNKARCVAEEADLFLDDRKVDPDEDR